MELRHPSPLDVLSYYDAAAKGNVAYLSTIRRLIAAGYDLSGHLHALPERLTTLLEAEWEHACP